MQLRYNFKAPYHSPIIQGNLRLRSSDVDQEENKFMEKTRQETNKLYKYFTNKIKLQWDH